MDTVTTVIKVEPKLDLLVETIKAETGLDVAISYTRGDLVIVAKDEFDETVAQTIERIVQEHDPRLPSLRERQYKEDRDRLVAAREAATVGRRETLADRVAALEKQVEYLMLQIDIYKSQGKFE